MTKLGIIGLVICLTITGCGRGDKPDGMPSLVPCTITITQNNAPAADVRVSLIGEAAARWGITGLTDASGTATMVTYGKFRGVPSGEYKVVLSHEESSAPEAPDNPNIPFNAGPTKVYSLVELKYTNEEKTPLSLSVDKKSVSETFEIGAPVRELKEVIK